MYDYCYLGASLDFGVFVCSNCSGSHRALGPTITRIKSTKLDQWNSAWLSNMQLGNLLINKYWEADVQTALARYILNNPENLNQGQV